MDFDDNCETFCNTYFQFKDCLIFNLYKLFTRIVFSLFLIGEIPCDSGEAAMLENVKNRFSKNKIYVSTRCDQMSLRCVIDIFQNI